MPELIKPVTIEFLIQTKDLKVFVSFKRTQAKGMDVERHRSWRKERQEVSNHQSEGVSPMET